LVAGAAAALAAVTVAAAPQAQAALTGVSTVAEAATPGRGLDPATGFPSWYADSTGTRLKLCVDSDFCLGGNSLPDPDAPASVATGNLPDEAFYAVARAETELNVGGRIRWRAVLEGAFANDAVVPGDQITFTRVQVTGSKIKLAQNTKLRFVTPYGTFDASVGRDGKLSRERVESNPGDPTDKFAAPLSETQTGFGPTFLRWDPAVAPAAPADHIGDPARLHRIVGGTNGNAFQVFNVTATGATGTAASPIVRTFEVAGQIAN
jgi:hypothetical protein